MLRDMQHFHLAAAFTSKMLLNMQHSYDFRHI